ncbi:hypothetical protein DNI29_06665 [Hymenobacter sediminis]|uniref:hypothetical protein n=1 Tax=Hymenobacter sediminis TaxID=2218621 RepID=UPI000F4E2EEC|nr:hypothetical protein [Hymenobacter sediminis]RPD48305.1 hypothetical protein DNI29_06665 [Hymenobacter sediminis]
MRITNVDTNEVVFHQMKSQATQPYASGATNLTGSCFMDTGAIPLASYRIEMLAETANVSFDCLRLTVPVGANGGGGASSYPEGFTGLIAPVTLQYNDPRVVLKVGFDGVWDGYGAMKYARPSGPRTLAANYQPVITLTNNAEAYMAGLRYSCITAHHGCDFKIWIDEQRQTYKQNGQMVTVGSLYSASEQPAAERALITGLNLAVHAKIEIWLVNYSFDRCNLFMGTLEFLA